MRLITRFLAAALLVSVAWVYVPAVDAATAPGPAKRGFAFPTRTSRSRFGGMSTGPSRHTSRN